MRVTVSCAGRFHAFDLVAQLHKRNALERFITTTLNDRIIPNRSLPPELRGDAGFRSKVREIPFPEYACAAIRRLPIADAQSLAYFTKDNLYDQRAAHYVGRSDIFTGWASQSLFSLREAKTRGAITIIERGSTHIEEQYRLIEEERRRFGVASPHRSRVDQLLIDKQLKEYHEADRIMVPSEFARESFLRRGFPDSKILKVRYGVDLSLFTPAAQQLTSGPLRVLFVGAVGFQKGVPHLLAAVAKLKPQTPVHLKLIGRMESDFEAWLKESALRSVVDEHLEHVPHVEMGRHMAQADVLCLPSIQEGLALVIAEAMASGLPVVATENTGGSEFISSGVNGQLVGAADDLALADALKLYADPSRQRDHREAAIEASRSFTWDHYGDEIERTYQSLLTTERSGGENLRDEIASYYDDYWDRDQGWTPTHSFTDEQLQFHFGNAFSKADTVLDVGCGDASNYQSWLVNQVGDLAALDISETGVANARRMGLQAIVHDLSKPFPFPTAAFDGATCIEVLEHLYDPKFTVGEIYRVLKPGGLLITSVPNNGYFRERLKALTRAELSTSITDFGNEWKGAHIRFYSLASFRRMLEVSGFEIESVRSNQDSSIFDGFDAIGGYITQHITTLLRRKLPQVLRLGFLEDIWPSLFAPHIIVWARKPLK